MVMLRFLVAVGLLCLTLVGTTLTAQAQTHPMLRNLASQDNYARSGDIVVGIRGQTHLEVIVMNLKTGVFTPS